MTTLEDDENKFLLLPTLAAQAGTSVEKLDTSALQQWALECVSMEDIYNLVFEESEFAVAAAGLGQTD